VAACSGENGTPPFLSGITAVVSQKSALEPNWGVKMKAALGARGAGRQGTGEGGGVAYENPNSQYTITGFPLAYYKSLVQVGLLPLPVP
jgi:hypothetical protein